MNQPNRLLIAIRERRALALGHPDDPAPAELRASSAPRAMIDITSFASTLRTIRERHGVSQSTLADRADCDHSFVSRLESGKREPSRAMVDRFAEAMGLDQGDRDRLMLSAKFKANDKTYVLENSVLAHLDQRISAASPSLQAWFMTMIELLITIDEIGETNAIPGG